MSRLQSEITFYVVITLGYVWSVFQIVAGEPFDALVLFSVTFMFHQYRNAVKDML